MATEATVIQAIPRDLVQLIPLFNGDKRHLNLFLRKCQYIIDSFCSSGETQNLYVFNVITSRLTENAAALFSEREDVMCWSALKALLIQHFGDPRSEACINIELESLKIKSGESYLEFCNRIQSVRSLLISKVNTNEDSDLKKAKLIIYDNTALNVFLYNLPENLVRIVRLKAPTTLEAALSVVLEEVNFLEQYNMRNRIHGNIHNTTPGSRPLITPQGQMMGYKPSFGNNNNVAPKFNFGIPQNTQIRMPPVQGQGQTNFGIRPQAFGYRPQLGLQPQPRFGLQPPQQFGYRPQPFGYKPPQAFGYKPPQPFGYRPNLPPQVGHSNPPQGQQPQLQITDVSMRTAAPRPSQNNGQGFKLNELTMDDYTVDKGVPYEYYDGMYYYDNFPEQDVMNYGYEYSPNSDNIDDHHHNEADINTIIKSDNEQTDAQDFMIGASDRKKS